MKEPGPFGKADFVADTQGVWVDGPLKLVVPPKGETVALYDIRSDPAEKADLADERLRADLDVWRQGVRASYDGNDYPPRK